MSLFNDETLQSKSSSLLSQPEGLLNHLVHIASTLIFLDPEVIRPVLFNSTILNKLGIEQGKLLLLKSIYSQHQLELTWISIYEDSSKYATHDISTILLVENCNQNGQFIKGIDFRLQLNIRLHVYDPPQLHYPPITPYIHFGEAEKKKNSSVSLASFNLTKEENWKIHTLRKTHQSQLFSILKNISKRFSSLIESVLQSRPIDENCKLLCEKLEGLFDPSSTSSPSSTDQDEDVSFTFSDAMEDDSFTLSSPLDGKALFEETIRRIEERALKAKETSQFDEEIVFSALPDEIEFNATEDEASNEDEERKNIHKREIPTSHLQYAKERTKPFDSIPPSSYSSSTSQSTEKNPSSFEVPISSESHSNNLVAKPLMNEPRFTCLPLRSNERISDMTKLLSIKTYIEELKSTWNRIELPKHEARQATYIKKYASKFDSIQKEIELIHESQIPTFMMKISAKAVTMEDLDLLKTALDVIVYELCRKEFLLSLLSQTQALKTDLSSISSSDSTLPASTLSEITMPLPSYDHHQKPEKLMSAASLAEPNPAHLHPSDLKSSLIKQKDVDSLSSPIDEVHGDESTTLDEESVDVDSDEEGEENEDDDDEDESNDEDVKNFIVEDHLVEWDIAEAEEKQIELLEAIRELFALYPSEWELFNALKQFCLRLAANKPLPERASAFLFLKITHSLVSKDLPSSTSMSQAWSETYSRCCSMISDFEKTHLDFHLVQRIASPVKKINISSSTDFPVFVPSFLEKVLEEHQIKGIRFMWDRIVSKKGGCILAHAMGLGKSLQVITFIACLCNEILKNKDSIPTHLHSRHFILFSPKTVLHSFWNELYKWVPKSFFQLHQFDAYLLEGNRLQRHSIVQTWNEKGGILFLTYDAAKSFTQPSEKIAMDELELKRLLFSQVALAIFDEAHIFKNHETQLYTLVKESLTTCSRIALTGTPLQNNLIEYFNMTEIISPGFLGTLDQFKSNFLLRIMDGQSSDSTRNQKRTSEYTLALLREVLSEFILREDNRLLKKKLPPLHEYVIYIELTSTQRKLALALFDNMGSDSRYLMVLGQRLIHIFNHPTVLIQSLSSPKGFSTQITSSDSSTSSSLSPSVSPDSNFTSVPMPISSESSPHASSSSSQTNTTRNLEPSNPELLDWVKEFSKLPDLSSLQQSSKMMVCMEIVKYSLLNEEKIIIFSQCLKSLTYLQGELTHRNIKWCRLDGQSSSKARQDLIHSFNTSVEMNVFLISTKTGGTGINLYSASRVIILDFQWNPTTEEQGIGRAYRIGQTRPVYVYRLVIPSTFEEAMLKRQLKKSALAQQTIDNKNLKKIFQKEEIRVHFEKSNIVHRMKKTLRRHKPYKYYHDTVLQNVYSNIEYVVSVSEMKSFFPPLKTTDINATHLDFARSEAQRLLRNIKTGQSWDQLNFPNDLLIETTSNSEFVDGFTSDSSDDETQRMDIDTASTPAINNSAMEKMVDQNNPKKIHEKIPNPPMTDFLPPTITNDSSLSIQSSPIKNNNESPQPTASSSSPTIPIRKNRKPILQLQKPKFPLPPKPCPSYKQLEGLPSKPESTPTEHREKGLLPLISSIFSANQIPINNSAIADISFMNMNKSSPSSIVVNTSNNSEPFRTTNFPTDPRLRTQKTPKTPPLPPPVITHTVSKVPHQRSPFFASTPETSDESLSPVENFGPKSALSSSNDLSYLPSRDQNENKNKMRLSNTETASPSASSSKSKRILPSSTLHIHKQSSSQTLETSKSLAERSEKLPESSIDLLSNRTSSIDTKKLNGASADILQVGDLEKSHASSLTGSSKSIAIKTSASSKTTDLLPTSQNLSSLTLVESDAYELSKEKKHSQSQRSKQSNGQKYNSSESPSVSPTSSTSSLSRRKDSNWDVSSTQHVSSSISSSRIDQYRPSRTHYSSHSTSSLNRHSSNRTPHTNVSISHGRPNSSLASFSTNEHRWNHGKNRPTSPLPSLPQRGKHTHSFQTSGKNVSSPQTSPFSSPNPALSVLSQPVIGTRVLESNSSQKISVSSKSNPLPSVTSVISTSQLSLPPQKKLSECVEIFSSDEDNETVPSKRPASFDFDTQFPVKKKAA